MKGFWSIGLYKIQNVSILLEWGVRGSSQQHFILIVSSRAKKWKRTKTSRHKTGKLWPEDVILINGKWFFFSPHLSVHGQKLAEHMGIHMWANDFLNCFSHWEMYTFQQRTRDYSYVLLLFILFIFSFLRL